MEQHSAWLSSEDDIYKSVTLDFITFHWQIILLCTTNHTCLSIHLGNIWLFLFEVLGANTVTNFLSSFFFFFGFG
jgi:hypothetical protein